MPGGRRPTIISSGGLPQQAHNYAAGYRALEFRRPINLGKGETLHDPETGKQYLGPTPQNRIPTQVHPREFGRMVRNLDTALTNVPQHKVREAQDWYARAHDQATIIGRKAGAGSNATHVGAGVLAALSPGVEWSNNVDVAHHIATHGYVPSHYGGYKTGADKARRIMAGEPNDSVLGHLKTGNFAHNIEDPSDSSFATIDSHQHNAAVGWKHPWKSTVYGLQTRSRYDTLVRATQAVAKRHDLPTTAAQAASWTGWKENNTGVNGSNYPVRW